MSNIIHEILLNRDKSYNLSLMFLIGSDDKNNNTKSWQRICFVSNSHDLVEKLKVQDFTDFKYKNRKPFNVNSFIQKLPTMEIHDNEFYSNYVLLSSENVVFTSDDIDYINNEILKKFYSEESFYTDHEAEQLKIKIGKEMFNYSDDSENIDIFMQHMKISYERKKILCERDEN